MFFVKITNKSQFNDKIVWKNLIDLNVNLTKIFKNKFESFDKWLRKKCKLKKSDFK